MVVFTEAVFWSFLLLARPVAVRAARGARPRRRGRTGVAGYPLTPALFCAACLFMVYASARYAWSQRTSAALWAVVLTGAGRRGSFFSVRRGTDA
jgi:hypothetical protein